MPEEVIKTEEVINEEELDNEVSEDEDAGDEAQTDEEKEQLRLENLALKDKNQKLYQKLKSGYKKHSTTKETIKKDFVSKEESRKIFEEIQNEKEDELKLVEKYEDAKDLLPEARKLKEEKGLSIIDAYTLVKGKIYSDEGYRNQILGERSANYGELNKKTSSVGDDIFSKGPKISQKRQV